MPWKQTKLIVDHSVRGLCPHPYPNHPKGCPNFNKNDRCPPRAPLIGAMLDLERETYVIWNIFDFAGHVLRMHSKHPDWTPRQLANCLYWQPTARKALRIEVDKFLAKHSGMQAIYTPEAMGVNITETMRTIGIELEWPPRTVTYQIAVAGYLAKFDIKTGRGGLSVSS